MNKISATIGALALAGAVLAANPAPASAAVGTGGCPASTLCVWDGDGFTGFEIKSTSTNSCYLIQSASPGFSSVVSYVNNLPVDAYVWDTNDYNIWYKHRTLVSGGFSSNIGVTNLGYPFGTVCEQSQNPNSYWN
ncbi:peptidase inhibitor family I36 protein [Streptacidiphilus griseoplanus]|uniref:peptidase inhibitor family I36 protein n=1 Tax=Peterkaempfera griseoplana TaxID=66896 RepID=UPI0006E26664|nr:peptidase inhibitor family I36 protein [Peterkaempfera griseoplana]